MSPSQTFPLTIKPLATLTPPSSTRAWHSSPHPDRPIVATASSDKSVRVYSLTSFTLLNTVSGGHKRSVRACAWKPHTRGETVLATGSFDASAGIWRKVDEGGDEPRDFTGDADADDDEYAFSVILDGHESEIKSLDWSASGQYLATCSRDKSVWIWEDMENAGDDFETVAVLQEHEGDVKCVAWHPEENLLVSSSYDDDVRLWKEDVDDWVCCTVLRGHDSTVWCVQFEPKVASQQALSAHEDDSHLSVQQEAYLEDARKAGPRLVSCSDDLSIRISKRRPKDQPDPPPTGQGRMPSILRTTSVEEEWYLETVLPKAHDRAVYSVAWSAQSGMVASTGSDGKIVIYRERWRNRDVADTMEDNQVTGDSSSAQRQEEMEKAPTEWEVVAEFDGAHDVFEVNHICWTKRRDKDRRNDNEEMLITTGDDGEVKVWVIES